MAHKWVGQMAGGVISGQRAAREVSYNHGGLKNIYINKNCKNKER